MYSLDIEVCSKEKNIIKKVYYSNNRIYYIFNYDKNMICYDNDKIRMYRSVVFSFLNKTVLSFSPPKSINKHVFMEKYPSINDDILITEYIDGTMVNLFYDGDIQKWEIATRYKIGGNYLTCNPAHTKTIRLLFMEALRSNEGEELNDLPIISLLPKEISYTFVLNINNTTINNTSTTTSQLYLVSMYNISQQSARFISPLEYETWGLFSNINGVIRFPKRLSTCDNDNNNYDMLSDVTNNIQLFQHVQKDDESSIGSRGLIVLNTLTGEHMKIPNYAYEKQKQMKHIQPNLQYQYFCFRRISKLINNKTTWLRDIPRNRNMFYKIHHAFEEFIQNVHISYMDNYIYKKKEVILEKYYTHICKIHRDIYLHSLKTNTRVKITRDIVRNYFDAMEPRELLYMINNDRR